MSLTSNPILVIISADAEWGAVQGSTRATAASAPLLAKLLKSARRAAK